jgi:uncharacterized protein (DUF1810 family)
MAKANDTMDTDDLFQLGRFVTEQEMVYDGILAELRSGHKQTHWIWFIFPQMGGLGHSLTSKYFAIDSEEEARQYLAHPALGKRLLECTETVLDLEGRSVSEIFDTPDDLKFQSSMALFAYVTNPDSVFARALDKYFQGQRDDVTLSSLEQQKANTH